MIIQLDYSLVDLAGSGASELAVVVSTLELLAISYREGNHLVFAEPPVVNGLLEMIDDQSGLARALLLRVHNKYSQVARLAKKVRVKLLVGAFPSASVEEYLECKLIKYPVSDVTSNLIQKTIVLVENLTDVDFYKWMAGSILKNTDYEGVHLALEGYPGGGNTTAEAYSNIKRNTSRLCVCIVDSDIRAPGLSCGDTAKKVKKDDGISPSPRASYHVIDACSVENLIPFEFFEYVWRDDQEMTGHLGKYKVHYRENHWKYLQLKKSISCFEVRDSSAFSVYWGRELQESATECKTPERSCLAKKYCKSIKLDSLSSAPLSAVSSVGMDVIERVPYELLPDMRRAWEAVTYELLAWCCAVRSSSL